MNKYDNSNRRPYPSAKKVAFSKYNGQFICQKCKADVTVARFWRDTFDFTWMCECKYVSKVNLYVKGY